MAANETIGIVGQGRFGQLLKRILEQEFAVCTYDSATDAPEAEQALLACETIFYALPISKFSEALERHCKHFLEDGKPRTLIDVLSVKSYAKETFEDFLPKNCEAILTHPMFGPDSVPKDSSDSAWLQGLKIVMDRFRSSEATFEKWRSFFTNCGMTVTLLTAEKHDRLAANSQGLAHFIGRVLDEFGMQETEIDTLGASMLMRIKEQTCNDSWELFTDLQNNNPFTIDMRIKLGRAVDRVYSNLLPNRIRTDVLTVGIQGGAGSFNEEAAQYYLKRNNVQRADISYLYTTDAVLSALHEGRIDRGQFAIHNSLGGIVQESVEAMVGHKFQIVEQFAIKISHALMVHPDVDMDEVDTIMTHPQVLKQCKGNLSQKYSRLTQKSGEGELIDHANVAAKISSGSLPKTIATMGSSVLAKVNGLRIVEENLQDLDQNFTSFLWVERPKG